MPSETVTPNIGLQIPAFNQPNWQVPTNYNWNLLDRIFGGEFTVPALSVAVFAIGNIGATLAAAFVAETPSGSIPGNTYILSNAPSLIIGFYWNGLLQRPGVDYTLAGNTITMMVGTSSGDTVYATYFK
jgi:hypothetical protein